MSSGIGGVLNKYVFGGDVKGPPGNAPVGAEDSIVLDPATGLYVDRNTGAHFTADPRTQIGGAPPVTVRTPSAADLVAGNNATASGFLNAAGGYDTREGQAYGQQQGLADQLRLAAMGMAPSAAIMGSHIAANDILGQQLGMSAGGTGANGAMNQVDAQRNAARAGIQALNAGNLGHVQEVQGAQQNYGNLLSGMAGESAGMAGQKLAAGEDYSKMALTGEMGREGLSEKANEADAANNTSITDKLLKGAGSVLTLGGLL